MSPKILALVTALVAGISMAIQGSVNTKLGQVIGNWEAILVVHVVGLVTILILLFVFSVGKGDLSRITQGPWYYSLGGLIGVLIVWGVVSSMPKLGVAVATTSIIVGQTLTALIIDHFGLFGLSRMPFTWLKGLGLVLLSVGAGLLLS
ncbi:MAG: DMT family transporter [Firmicutes bacterium]|nr:DMT family transporter [Bacillota bacterium]HXL03577.1 DMT family transporter [Bacillota bacterium]